MKSTRMILLLIASLCVVTVPATAFDGGRSGFQLGFELGAGHAMLDSYEVRDSQVLVSKKGDLGSIGLATAGLVGYGLSEQLSVYYSNRAVWFSRYDSVVQQGLTGLGVTYHFQESAPSFFVSGVGGFAWLTKPDDGLSAVYGIGASIGVGYEFSRHYSIELNLMRASLSLGVDLADDLNVGATNITVGFSAIAF